jgi:hypothetical protein
MFLKDSRYARVARFEPDPDGRADFQGIRLRPIPPTPGVLEHTETEDDRPDRLANEFYSADRAWWRILDANPDFLIAGPIRSDDGARVSGGDGVLPEQGNGDVMISDAMKGDVVLIPRRKD